MRNPKRRDDRARCHVFAADGPARNQTHPDVRQRPQTRGMTVRGRTLKLLRSRRLRLRAHQRLKRLRPASRSQRREIRFSSLIYLLCFRFAIATPVLWRSSWIKENDPDLFKLGHCEIQNRPLSNAQRRGRYPSSYRERYVDVRDGGTDSMCDAPCRRRRYMRPGTLS